MRRPHQALVTRLQQSFCSLSVTDGGAHGPLTHTCTCTHTCCYLHFCFLQHAPPEDDRCPNQGFGHMTHLIIQNIVCMLKLPKGNKQQRKRFGDFVLVVKRWNCVLLL